MKQKALNTLYSPKTAAKPLWPWFSFIFAVCALFLFQTHQAQAVAANYTPDQITFSMDTQVADSSGNFSNGNFIKLVSGQAIKMRVVFQLTGPATGLNISMDGTKADNIFAGGQYATINRLVIEARSVSDPSNKNSGVKIGSTGLAASASFAGAHLDPNSPQTFDFTIPWSSITSSLTSGSLNLDHSTFGSNTPNFLVAPVIFYPQASAGFTGAAFRAALGITLFPLSDTEVLFAPQKRVYVKIYPDAATAAADTTKPADVPVYGAVSGNVGTPTPFNTSDPFADGLTKLLNEIVSFVLGLIQELIFAIFSFLIAPLISAILSIHVYTDSFVAVIYTGWEVVRNLCNIFFIVALIIIALATLFRVESYKYKDLLVQLIIAALLVNFSLVIAQAVLGIADTVQAQFLGDNIAGIRNLAKQLMLNNNSWLRSAFSSAQSTNSNASAQNGSLFGGIIQSIFWLALSLGTLAVFAAIAAFLVIRIVAIWLLLLVSPVAYAVGVLPATAHYREEWWKNFLKYAFFTPIMAFFLNMAAIMAQNAQTTPILQRVANDSGLTSLNGLASLVVNMGSNILLLVFLIASLKVADMAGIYGAAGITDLAKKGIFAPFAGAAYLGKAGAGRVGRAWNDFTSTKIAGEADKKSWGRSLAFAALNPVAAAKAWRKRSEELKETAQHKAEAAGMMVVEQRLTHGHKIIPRVQQHAKAEADKFVKDFNSMSREKQVQIQQDIIQLADNEEGKAMKRAMATAMMSRGFIDDAIQDGTLQQLNPKTGKMEDSAILKKMYSNHHFTIEKPDWVTHKENKDWYIDEKDGQYKMRYDTPQIDAYFEAVFGNHDQEAGRMLAEEGEKYGKDTFHPEYMGIRHYDMKKGEYRPSSDMVKDGEFAGEAFIAAEWSKMNYRQQAQIVHHALKGRGGKMHGKIVQTAQNATVEGVTYGQERNSKDMSFGRDQVVDGVNFDSKSGAITVGPQTYLNWKQGVEKLGAAGTMLAYYSRATGGKLTGGKYSQEQIRGLEADLKYIQANPGADYLTAKAANGNKDRAITEEHWDYVRKNGGLKITVKSAEQVHDLFSEDPAKKAAAMSSASDIKQVKDILGAVAPAGTDVNVDDIKF